jgi:hypothetical protein
MFPAKVSELYRTGQTIKRVDRHSLDEHTNRYVYKKNTIEEVKGTKTCWDLCAFTISAQMSLAGGQVPECGPE